MAFNLLLLGILISFFISTDAQSVGVCYGEMGGGLPSQQDVVNLYRRSSITKMRVYGPNPNTLRALSGTNIELILDVPNRDLEALNNQNAATNWVRNNVLNYPSVRFRYISVRNEVDPNTGTTAGVADRIKVSTATYTGLLKNSFQPSDGVFHDNVISFIGPIITFLAQNGSPMLANIYPYFAYIGNPEDISLSYALFTEPTQGRQYFNLFDAMYDAHYAAQSRLGGANVPIVVSGSGWSSAGRDVVTLGNAGTYYRNLISRVKSTRGTPARPGRSIETYLFAMFDENQKPGDPTEQHFRVFSPDQTSKYQLSF